MDSVWVALSLFFRQQPSLKPQQGNTQHSGALVAPTVDSPSNLAGLSSNASALVLPPDPEPKRAWGHTHGLARDQGSAVQSQPHLGRSVHLKLQTTCPFGDCPGVGLFCRPATPSRSLPFYHLPGCAGVWETFTPGTDPCCLNRQQGSSGHSSHLFTLNTESMCRSHQAPSWGLGLEVSKNCPIQSP